MTKQYIHKCRYDEIGKLRMIACAEGYVMVCRSGCMPFVLDGKVWNSMPTDPEEITKVCSASPLSPGEEK